MIQRFFFNTLLHAGWLPVFRCGIAVLLLLTGLQLWPDFDLLYGPESILDHRLLQLGENRPLEIFAGEPVGRWHLAAYLVCCVLLALGIATRLAALGLWLFHQWLYMAHPAFSYGFDYLACSALFYCVWFPVRNPASHWATPCLRVLQLHLCLIYFFGGLDKILGPTWRNGEALWKALHLPELTGALRPEVAYLEPYPEVVAVLGWGVILLEIGYPLCIWLHATRRIWLGSIIAMHAGIAVFLGLYHFSALMILFNVSAFLLPYRRPPLPLEQIAIPIPKSATALSRRADPSAGNGSTASKPNAQHV